MENDTPLPSWLKRFQYDPSPWPDTSESTLARHARSLAQLAEKVALLQLELDDLKLRLGRQEQP